MAARGEPGSAGGDEAESKRTIPPFVCTLYSRRGAGIPFPTNTNGLDDRLWAQDHGGDPVEAGWPGGRAKACDALVPRLAATEAAGRQERRAHRARARGVDGRRTQWELLGEALGAATKGNHVSRLGATSGQIGRAQLHAMEH